MSSSANVDPVDELERLRAENHGLEEQVKRLVRAERRLSVSQRVLETQLQRVEVLNDLALRASGVDDEGDVLGLALDVLFASFAVEQGIGVIVDAGSARVAATRAVRGRTRSGDEPPASIPLAPASLDEPICGDALALEHEQPDARPFLALLDATFGRDPRATVQALLVPIRSRTTLRGALVARRLSPSISFVETMPTPDDAPFLTLLGAHVATAVDEIALFRAAERSAEEASRRAHENARLYQEARSAVQLRDEFLCVASHELKTPLTTLLLHVQRLRRSRLEEAQLAPIEKQAQRLAALVDQLVAWSADAAEPAPALVDVELGELARHVLARHADALAKARCPVVLACQGPAWARVDPAQLAEALSVLVSNAGKFGEGAPIEVAIEEGEATVRVRVRDHGIGIAHADQGRVFDRFARAVSYRHYGGLGLGLFAARRIVEAHGGTIAVESEPGEGAAFTIELPRAPSPGQPGGTRMPWRSSMR